jgi:hypothetical protein
MSRGLRCRHADVAVACCTPTWRWRAAQEDVSRIKTDSGEISFCCLGGAPAVSILESVHIGRDSPMSKPTGA